MAEVFEAALAGELGFERKVAIKRMLPSAAEDAVVARRFLDEARIASRLHHANIVSVLDLGLLDGVPFQVLELVEGLDGDQLVQRAGGRVPIEIALVIAAEIAHALDHAHHAADESGTSFGLVHRDVKPSNILVSWAGDVKLTDFGIAVARDRAARTEAGSTAGTRGFMAPEQRLRGEIDGRTDVFALGLALHVMATGTNPLHDVTAEIALLEGAPLVLDSSLPADVRTVIARAVAPQRLERSSAAQLADEIDALLATRQVRDRRRELRTFLAQLAPRTQTVGSLDRLLGLEVVATADAVDGVASYVTVTRPAPTPRPTAPPRSRRSLAVVIAGVVAAGAIAFAIWPRDEPHVAITPTLAVPTAPEPIAPPPVANAASTTLAAPAESPRPAAASRHVFERDKPRRASHPTAPVPEATPVGTGYVQIAGEHVMGMQVLVDGTPQGYAPHKLAVSLGRHRIELVAKDGTRTAPMEIEVTSFHTFGSPARPRF
jgi:hypothetical protein